MLVVAAFHTGELMSRIPGLLLLIRRADIRIRIGVGEVVGRPPLRVHTCMRRIVRSTI